MSEYDKNDPELAAAARTWGEITAALKALEGKTDSESCARREELLDDLIGADMALAPMKQAMAESARRRGLDSADG
jgi:hypothetical protein